jgi:hypothetical protein
MGEIRQKERGSVSLLAMMMRKGGGKRRECIFENARSASCPYIEEELLKLSQECNGMVNTELTNRATYHAITQQHYTLNTTIHQAFFPPSHNLKVDSHPPTLFFSSCALHETLIKQQQCKGTNYYQPCVQLSSLFTSLVRGGKREERLLALALDPRHFLF